MSSSRPLRLVGALLRPPTSSRTYKSHLQDPIRLWSRRYASTGPLRRTGPASRLKLVFLSTGAAVSGYLAYLYTTDTRASLHRWLVPRVLRFLYPDAEDAHHAAVSATKLLYSLGLHPRERYPQVDSPLSVAVFGVPLANPIGISAGLDKHADIADPLFALGAAVVEVGGCTPLPQPGNPRPRMFRVTALDGYINRYGLNSIGADAMAQRLRTRVRLYAWSAGLTETEVLDGEANVPPGSLWPGRLLAVQIAKNKETPGEDVAAVSRDYTYCVSKLAPYADILVVNVSSPNTPGLRDLQSVEPLSRILSAVVEEAKKTQRKTTPKVMVKVSPDEDTDAQIEGIVQAVWQSGVDGVIVGNTTTRRVGIKPPGVVLSTKEEAILRETGGFSGPMLFDRTLTLTKRYRRALDGRSFAAVAAEDEKSMMAEAVDATLQGMEGAVTGLVKDTPVVHDPPAGEAIPEAKVIFATGGITNGYQALQILNAGASVAMVYTALSYGGAGTITRIKSEMRNSLTIG